MKKVSASVTLFSLWLNKVFRIQKNWKHHNKSRSRGSKTTMESGGGNYQKGQQYSIQHQNPHHHQHHEQYFVHHLVKSMVLSAALALAFIVLYHSADRFELLPTSMYNKFPASDGFSSSVSQLQICDRFLLPNACSFLIYRIVLALIMMLIYILFRL